MIPPTSNRNSPKGGLLRLALPQSIYKNQITPALGQPDIFSEHIIR
jgi:hypothetical protein